MRADKGAVAGRSDRTRVAHRVARALGLMIAAGSAPALAADVIVNPLVIHQPIDGFGASSAWTTQNLSDSDADLLFLAANPDGGAPGIGMSLLRIRAAPDGTSLEVNTAQKAQARGAKVWATPWSPPAEWKVGTDDAGNGGSLGLDGGQYEQWADRLVLFLQNMGAAGVNIVALSAQNEPTFAAVNSPTANSGYESCVYTPDQLTSFIGQYLGPALRDAGVMPPFGIVAPETQSWSDFPAFTGSLLADPAASLYVGTLASHEYGSSVRALDLANPPRFWETEIYEQKAPTDTGMSGAIWMAEDMHNALTLASVNAWHFWWIHPQSNDNSGLYNLSAAGLAPSKRLYVMGNFSRFVRPGFYRIDATPAAQNLPVDAGGGQVYVSTYCDGSPCDGASSHRLVIVAINASADPVTQTFDFSSVTTGSWQSWVTSDALDLMPGDAISGSAEVTYLLQPDSVTTLVGQINGTGPALVSDAATGGGTVAASASSGAIQAAVSSQGCGLACSTIGRMPDDEGSAGAIGAGAVVALAAFVRTASRRRRANSERPSL